MTNRRRSEGFQVGSLVVAIRDAQGLELGKRYVITRREIDSQQGKVRYSVIQLETAAAKSFEVTNLPLLAEMAELERL